MIRHVLKFIRSLVIAALAAIAVWTIVLMALEDQFIYFPSVYPEGLYGTVHPSMGIADCWFTTADSVKLHGWYMESPDPIATLLLSHGNAGNISHRLDLMRRLHRAGFNVFMYDYRGYGRSDGSPSEKGIYLDGRAAFDHSTTLPGVDPTRIILFGTSLGGAVSVDVVKDRSPAALILEATFSSGKDLAQALYPFLPVTVFMKSEFNSIEKIRSITIPLLIIHGTDDSIVPLRLARRLFDAANEPKEFYEIAGADHNDTYFVGRTPYFEKIADFARRSLDGR